MSNLNDGRFPVDPELDALLGDDPALQQMAARVRASRIDPELDPRYKAVLRARLMRDAPAILTGKSWWARRKSSFAFGGLAVAVAGAAAAAVLVFVGHTSTGNTVLTANSSLGGQVAVNPSNAITVSFSQPMNEASVARAIVIQPATAYTTSWQGSTLVIQPTHGLASNTPYVVTINHDVAQSTSGARLNSDVMVTFGTTSTPTPSTAPTPSGPGTFSGTDVANSDGDLVAWAADGSVVTNTGGASGYSGDQPSGSPFAGPAMTTSNASPAASPSASPSATDSGSASPSSTSQVSGGLDGAYDYPVLGGASRLGDHANVVAVASDGTHVALGSSSNGQNQLVITDGDGTAGVTIPTDSAVVAIAWSSNNTVIDATATVVQSSDASGHVATLRSAPQGQHFVAISPDGHYAATVSASGPGSLIDISSGRQVSLASAHAVTFSGDSQTVAWTNTTTGDLCLEPTSGGTVQHLGLAASPDLTALPSVSLNHDGSEVAYVGSDGHIQVVATSGGAVVATSTSTGVALPTFDDASNRLAWVTTGNNPVLDIDVIAEAQVQVPQSAVPAPALSTLDQFLTAQSAGDTKALQSLSANGIDATAKTPAHVDRGYIIFASLHADGKVVALCRLVDLPDSGAAAVQVAQETVTLTPQGNGFTVTDLTVGALAAQSTGPHVVHVVASPDGSTFAVTFDADLQSGSVAGAISLLDKDGKALPSSVHYDAATRTATVVRSEGGNVNSLTIATTLTDAAGQKLATAFVVSIN